MEPLAATDWWVVGSNLGVAGGTFAAAAVALFVAVREGRQHAAAKAEERLAQARLVTSVLHFPVITVTNGSSRPLLEVNVAKVLLGDAWVAFHTADNAHGPLQPGESWSWSVPNDDMGLYQHRLDRREEIGTVIWFTDATGLRWQRTNNTEPVTLTAELAEEVWTPVWRGRPQGA